MVAITILTMDMDIIILFITGITDTIITGITDIVEIILMAEDMPTIRVA